MTSIVRIVLTYIVSLRVVSSVVRPAARLLVSIVAIPLFRFTLRRVVMVEAFSQELQKDLEQWFRGSVVLLIATRNMEAFLFGWIPAAVRDQYEPLAMGMRILLAIGVIEAMPDQSLFSIIHPGPSMLLLPKGARLRGMRENWRALSWGLAAKHLNRSSPVFAILAVLLSGPVGWVCYGFAVVQYLIIGLVSSRDAAIDALEQFDRQWTLRRKEVKARVEQIAANAPPQTTGATAGARGAGRP